MKRLLVLLALLPAAAVAQQSPPPEEAPKEAKRSGPELLTDLRPEYIQGEKVMVRFTLTNPLSSPVQFADLATRPWLVHFELVDKAGKKQTWYTTPPEEDPGGTWTIAPRAQRKVLLEIPSSSRLKKGEYTMTVRILDDAGELILPAHAMAVVPAQPVAGDTLYETDGLARNGHHTVWVQKSADGYDLYLHHADGKNPTRTIGDYHLLHLDQSIEPLLSTARSQERWNRYIVWQSGPRTVNYLRMDGQEVRGEPSKFDTPYPKVELIARPSTDANGGLHIPIWIPGPKGVNGQVMVVSLQGHEGPTYRNIARLDRKPDWSTSAVDAGGHLRLLFGSKTTLDLYTVTAGSDLPGVGKRIDTSNARPLFASFAYLAKTATRPGGLAVLALLDLGEGQAEASWFSLDGTRLETLGTTTLPESGSVSQLFPVGEEGYAALHEGESSRVLFAGGSVELTGDPTILIAKDEDIWVRSIEKGGPIKSRPVPTD